MKIIAIDCHVLLIPAAREDATDSAQDNLVVFIHTDTGLTGVGESDANPWMLKAAIEAPSTHTMGMGLKDMLMGADPLDDAEAIWERLYVGTAMNGRRGMVIHALGALDMALWDIKGKAAGKPCWELLLEPGVSPPPHVVPYASLQPSGGSLEEYRNSLVTWATKAKELGFRAAKLEATLTGPYAHEGMNDPSPASVTSIVAAVRAAVGPDFTLMVAVQYAYEAAEPVAAMIAEWERRHLDVLFLETPLRMDATEQISALGAMLAERHCSTAVAYGEWQATRHEFAPLLPHIGVLQPDAGRVGGLTEARRVCRMAAEHGKSVAPHCWKSGIGIAAAVHLAAAAPDVCRFVEFLPTELSSSPLRQRLTTDDEAALQPDGTIALPRRPGLGVTVDMAALREFEGYAAAAIERGAGHGKGMAALAAPQQASGATRSVAHHVLIVGCGAAARCHVDAMRATGRFVCVALADTEPAAAAALSALLVSRGGKPPQVFETLEEALDADPDSELFGAVWVLTPNTKKLHTELAAMALDAGRHVLLEKPISRNLSEGRDLANKVNAIEQTTVRALRPRLMVAETSAFWPAVTAVGAAISRGDVGEVCMIRAKCWIPPAGAWAERYKADSWLCTGGEGGLFDAITHWIRPLRMWFGEIEKVVCMSADPLSRMRGPSSMQAFFRFVSGKSAVFEAILTPHAISDQPFFQIQGDLGEIVLDGFGGGVYLYSGDPSGGGPSTFGTKVELCRCPWESAYEEELKAFAAAIHDGDELPSKAGADEALRDLALVRAIFESAGDDAKFGWVHVTLKLGGRLNYEDV